MVPPETLLDEVPFVFFDVETTGLSPHYGHKICEFGGVRMVGESVQATVETLINPEMPMPPEVIPINGITDSMVKDAPTFDQVYPSMLDLFQDSIIVAHNARFDVKFMASSFERYGFPNLLNCILDSIRISKKLNPGQRRHSLDHLKGLYQVETQRSHRALDDALALAAIFGQFIEMMKQQELTTFGDLLKLHGTSIAFSYKRKQLR